uniref:BHLH domain-containing protein n=1 Tax=Physcomitrium patens TaxID=3218 RepID=A0A2K1J0D1_PHYPA|nr:hypothetical protein PHYPA_022885 [Physcomitrium patens]
MEKESSFNALRELVIGVEWTYRIIWKLELNQRSLICYQSYFNEREATEVDQAQEFQLVYCSRQFATSRPGYAYNAWKQQSSSWWTPQLMQQVPTDENRDLFLRTLVCFPGRTDDGIGYCVELATKAQILETDTLRSFIQGFLYSSIAPHIQEEKVLRKVGGRIEGFPQASRTVTLPMEPVEHNSPWAMTVLQANANLGQPSVGIQELKYVDFPIHNSQLDLGSIDLPDIIGRDSPNRDPSTAFLFSTEWMTAGGKEIAGEGGIHLENLAGTPIDLQLRKKIAIENLDKILMEIPDEQLQASPSLQTNGGILDTTMTSPGSSFHQNSPTGIGKVGQVPPGHSSKSLFRPRRKSSFARLSSSSKRQPMIHNWAKNLAPKIVELQREAQPLTLPDFNAYESPGYSPHEHYQAVAHKLAERDRRFKFNQRMQTLISIVPIISKVINRFPKFTYQVLNISRTDLTALSLNRVIDTLTNSLVHPQKDKVSVLTSTIAYIHQLTSRISRLEKGEELPAQPQAPTMETPPPLDAAGVSTLERVNQQTFVSDEAGAGRSSPSWPSVLVDEDDDDSTLIIKLEASNNNISLIQLLNLLLELDLRIRTLDYVCTDGRFSAKTRVKNSKTSNKEIQVTLQRFLRIKE